MLAFESAYLSFYYWNQKNQYRSNMCLHIYSSNLETCDLSGNIYAVACVGISRVKSGFFLCARLCSGCFVCINLLNSHREIVTIVSILEMKK